MPMPCAISLEQLLDLHEGRLDGEAAAALRRHLDAGCPACGERLRWIEGTLGAFPASFAPVPEPSADALAYVKSLARLLQPPAGRGENLVRHIARLVFDGGSPRAPAEARSPGAPAAQRVFETEVHLITLWDEPEEAADQRYLIGQVYARSGTALPPRSVSLLLADAPEREAEIEGSEFHLPGVAPGVYLIRCRLDAAEVLLPRVEVGLA